MVLGVTGSIGTQTLEVADTLGLDVVAVAARSPSGALMDIVRRYPAVDVAVSHGKPGKELADAVPTRIGFGPEAVTELAARAGVTVVNGIVGSAGLAPTLAALEAGNRVALANKESMVAAGELVNQTLERHGGELIPIDSEHSALHQCLAGEQIEDVARLVLTASGGPFRGWHRDDLRRVGPDEALNHPTWKMGGRITIDSATLMNKGLEVIEAHHLFGVDFDSIDVVVHPQSTVHSAVEFVDGALKAHLGHPDMRVPIQYALTYPQRRPNPGDRFSLAGQTLEFEDPDRATFPALDLAYAAGRSGGSAPAVLNAADEVAVEAFLAGRIGFLDIVEVLAASLEEVDWRPLETLDDVLEVDREARHVAERHILGTPHTSTGRVG